jgi:uncharacterized protein (DUF305 family)
MKRLFVLAAAAGFALVSVTAFAQMRPRSEEDGTMRNQEMMHGQGMQGQGMQGQGMHGQGMQGMMREMHGMMEGMQGMHGSASQSRSGHREHRSDNRGDTGPSSLAFNGINQKMHEAMNISFSGNADIDFVKGMIPHHEGAVDMAKVVLAFGKDPEVKRLAEAIIKAQEQEIAWMKDWVSKNARP